MTQHIGGDDNTLPDGFDPDDEQWYRLTEAGATNHPTNYETFVPESEFNGDVGDTGRHPFTTHTIYVNPPPDFGSGPEDQGQVYYDRVERVDADDIQHDISNPATYWGDVS